MELLDSMGRELAWGLLALQQQSVSRAGLLAAIDVWHGLPHQPLGQILLERQALTLTRPPSLMRRFKISWIARIPIPSRSFMPLPLARH